MVQVGKKRAIKFWKYYKEWYETYKYGDVRDVTYQRYILAGKQIKELAPDLMLDKITRADIQKLINTYGQTHEKTTVRDFYRILEAPIRDAVYEGWISRDPCYKIRITSQVAQWEKESDQPSNQTPVDDSQVPEENSQALNTQGSQATVPTSQSATPASQAKLSSQPATQELTQQASVADPASQPITQSTAQKPQQASVSVQADKTNLPAQNKKPVQERTEQSSVATLPQTGNQAGLGAISIGIASALAMFGLAGVKRD